MKKVAVRNSWTWVPSLYFAEGLPYVVVNTLSVIMYKRLEISNTEIALYTSWLYLPWVMKPLWSPIIDIFKTKRVWIVVTQSVLGIALAGVAFAIPMDYFLQVTLAFFWLAAFSSATHDIAADGFYMIAQGPHDQAFFVGIRSTFYRIAMITGQGGIVIFAGKLEKIYTVQYAWTVTLGILAALMLLAFFYHQFILPHPPGDKPAAKSNNFWKDFADTFVLFFKKENIGIILAFLLLFRFGEAQLVKLASPFLLDDPEVGGLGLDTEMVGFAYGTVGIIALVIGGVSGGILASKHGLKFWLWWMMIAVNLPNLAYVYLSYTIPENFVIVSAAVGIEQFGYGFGFTAYMLYMIYIVEKSEHKTAHYAIATAFMALGMMLPGFFSGWLQEQIGYKLFFIWVVLAGLPAFIVARFLNIDPNYGKKQEDEVDKSM